MSDFTSLLPALTADEFEALKADIAERGCLVPVEIDEDGQVLDGAHRLRACGELGIKPPTITRRGLTEDEKRAHAIALNLQRRQLDRDGRAELHRELRGLGTSLREIAEASGVPKSTVERDTKGVTVPGGTVRGRDGGREQPARRLKPAPVLDFPEQPEHAPAITRQQAEQKATRAEKDAERQAQRDANADKIAASPDPLEALGVFSTIAIDPPWDFGDEGDHEQLGRGRPTYATLTAEEIANLPIGDHAADDAHLYLWITNRSLPKGFGLLDRWGFRYVTCLTWVKPSFGMGNYFRGSTEQVLFGVRGSLPLARKDAATHFTAHRGPGGHSSKPDAFYELVESCSPAPRLDFFGRRDRDGWTVRGEGLAA